MIPVRFQRVAAAAGLALVTGMTAVSVGQSGVGQLGELAASVRGFGASVGRAVFAVALPGDQEQPVSPAERAEAQRDARRRAQQRATGSDPSGGGKAAEGGRDGGSGVRGVGGSGGSLGLGGRTGAGDGGGTAGPVKETVDDLVKLPSPKAESAGPDLDGGKDADSGKSAGGTSGATGDSGGEQPGGEGGGGSGEDGLLGGLTDGPVGGGGPPPDGPSGAAPASGDGDDDEGVANDVVDSVDDSVPLP